MPTMNECLSEDTSRLLHDAFESSPLGTLLDHGDGSLSPDPSYPETSHPEPSLQQDQYMDRLVSMFYNTPEEELDTATENIFTLVPGRSLDQRTSAQQRPAAQNGTSAQRPPNSPPARAQRSEPLDLRPFFDPSRMAEQFYGAPFINESEHTEGGTSIILSAPAVSSLLVLPSVRDTLLVHPGSCRISSLQLCFECADSWTLQAFLTDK